MKRLNKALMKAGLIVGGSLIADDVFAMTDGALKAAWEASKIEDLLTKDSKRIMGVITVAAAGFMFIKPEAPKIPIIGGAAAAIVGTGFLNQFVQGSYAVLI